MITAKTSKQRNRETNKQKSKKQTTEADYATCKRVYV